jgi:hypothetical protein
MTIHELLPKETTNGKEEGGERRGGGWRGMVEKEEQQLLERGTHQQRTELTGAPARMRGYGDRENPDFGATTVNVTGQTHFEAGREGEGRR